MSSSKAEVVQHFTHIHPLTKVDGVGRYICDGCKTYGFGRTYRCASCDYDLHEFCALGPRTVPSILHPQHELRLVHQDGRWCDICKETTKGLFYQCKPCGFDVHPLCSQQPQKVSHNHGDTNRGELQVVRRRRIRKKRLLFGLVWGVFSGDFSSVASAFF